MAKNILQKHWNGTAWEELHPITKASNVITNAAESVETVLGNKVDKVAGKDLSTNDYTTAEKNKLAGIAAGAQVNTVNSVAGKTGNVTLTKADVGLSNLDNVQQAPITHVGAGGSAHAAATTSTAGFMSAADKSKLDGIATGANNYVHPSSHPASMITQDANNRFVSDAEKSTWNAKASTTVATTSANGLMSSSDKSKLDGIATGAQVNRSQSTQAQATAGTDTATDMSPARVMNAIDSRSRYGLTTGTATALVLTLSPAPASLYNGMQVSFRLHSATGASPTLNVNGLGAKSLLDNYWQPFVGEKDRTYIFMYDGINFLLIAGGAGAANDVSKNKMFDAYPHIASETVWVDNPYFLSQPGFEYTMISSISTSVTTINMNSTAYPIVNPNGTTTFVANGTYSFVYSHGYFFLRSAGGGWNVGQTIPTDKLVEDASITENYLGNFGNQVRGIAVDIEGYMYLGLWAGATPEKSVIKLTAAGAEVWSKTDGVGVTNKLIIDQNNNVYTTHSSDTGKTVRKFNSSGTEQWSKTDVPNPLNISVDHLGQVYVAHNTSSSKSVRKLNSSGTEQWSKTDDVNARAIAVDQHTYVYVGYSSASTNFLRKLDPTGAQVWALTEAKAINNILVDALGYLYVAVSGSGVVNPTGGSIRRYTPSGDLIWSKTDVNHGNDIAIDREGNVYCSHALNSTTVPTITKYDVNGNRIWESSGYTNGYSVSVDRYNQVYAGYGGGNLRRFTQVRNGYKVKA